MLDGVIVPIQQALFSILYFLSIIFWELNQALLLVGYYILTITSWLSESMFQPLLESVGNSTDSLLLPVFTLAMLTLAITYFLGVFGVFRVVEFKSAVMWLFVAVMWFQFGPEIYLGFEGTRRELGGAFFATTFTDLTNGEGSIEGLGSVGDAGDLNISPPTNNFGAFLSFDTAIDGLDIALAYLDADGCDVLRQTGCLVFLRPDGTVGDLPTTWYTAGSYFDFTQDGFNFPSMSNPERQASLDSAASGIWRALSGTVVSFFGMLEQIVQLLLTIAFGIGFASFFIAILFAFFKKTESVTWAVFDVILGLFIQSIITSLLLALVMAFVSVAGATGNGILLLGVGFIGIILVTVLLMGAVSAILKSLNGLMGSFGSVTGGSLSVAGSVGQLAGAYATGGATLLGGGSVAQAVGGVLGSGAGQKAYYAAQAFGGGDTALGRVAQDVASGSAASYLGPVGGYVLGRSNKSEDEDKLSAQSSMSDLTLGTAIQSNHQGGDEETPLLAQRAAEGADIRLDPITQQAYEFDVQDNGVGLRTYEDGSRLYTSQDDDPQNRERARDERQALRQHEASSGFTQDDVNRLDASDDDESATLNSSLSRLGVLVATSNANSDVSDSTVNVIVPADILPPKNNDDSRQEKADLRSGTRAEFVGGIEHDYPGSTRHPDLVQQNELREEQDTSIITETASTQELAHRYPVPLSSGDIKRSDDGVRLIRSIGPSTEEQLASLNITTAGQLAQADPTALASLERITPARATQLVHVAQDHITPTSVAQSAVPQQIQTAVSLPPTVTSLNVPEFVAPIDTNHKEHELSLATGMGEAISSTNNTGRIPNSHQATQIAQNAGLPAIREAGQFVQVASAMRLSPQQAQAVIHDVQQTGQIGSEMSGSIRSSLSSLTLPKSGQPLGDQGMSRAVGNLERAAQSLITASNNLQGGGGESGSDQRDRVTAGATNTAQTPSPTEG
jgi:predicted flap endonuclease-1-like 5' DNA nuclease